MLLFGGVCMAEECPKCHSKMIKRYTNQVLLSYPPQYPWYWWCGCGERKEGGTEQGKSDDEMSYDEWKKVNE